MTQTLGRVLGKALTIGEGTYSYWYPQRTYTYWGDQRGGGYAQQSQMSQQSVSGGANSDQLTATALGVISIRATISVQFEFIR